MIKSYLFLFFYALLVPYVYTGEAFASGGVGVNTTRVIFPSSAESVTVDIRNTDSSNKWLVQSMVLTDTDSNESASNGFVTIPPMFTFSSPGNQSVRIIKNKTMQFPSDRESLFWFFVRAIPSALRLEHENDKTHSVTTNVQFATGTKIKLLYRPENLPVSPEDGFGSLTFNLSGKDIKVKNPSPYYVNFSSVEFGGIKYSAGKIKMIPPFSEVVITDFPHKTQGKVKWSVINDQGGVRTYNGELK